MANDNVQTDDLPATGKLAQELEALHDRVRRMEGMLRGAESIAGAVTKDGMLGWTPKDVDDQRDQHRRAMEMIEFLADELAAWRKTEAELDFPSDDIWELWERAKDGRLLRYGKPMLEPVQ